MRILITGANGNVGRILGNYFSQSEHELVGAVPDTEIKALPGFNEVVHWKMSEANYCSLLTDDLDVIVHLAFDSSSHNIEKTIDAVVTLACNARMKGLRQVIVCPVLSDQVTNIRKFDTKLVTARRLRKMMPVVETGVVVSSGGELGALVRYINQARIFTFSMKKTAYLPLTFPGSIGKAVEYAIETQSPGPASCFDCFVSLRCLVTMLLKQRRRYLFRFPLPNWINRRLLSIWNKLNGSLPNLMVMSLLNTFSTERFEKERTITKEIVL